MDFVRDIFDWCVECLEKYCFLIFKNLFFIKVYIFGYFWKIKDLIIVVFIFYRLIIGWGYIMVIILDE